jgi:hypothetical protein
MKCTSYEAPHYVAFSSLPPLSPLKGKGKGKVVPVLFLTEHHAMKAYRGSGGIAPRIL